MYESMFGNTHRVADHIAAGLRPPFGVTLTSVAGRPAAACDTRLAGPAPLTGWASTAMARELRQYGFDLVVRPESFLVDRQNRPMPGEADRAMVWSASLGTVLLRTESAER